MHGTVTATERKQNRISKQKWDALTSEQRARFCRNVDPNIRSRAERQIEAIEAAVSPGLSKLAVFEVTPPYGLPTFAGDWVQRKADDKLHECDVTLILRNATIDAGGDMFGELAGLIRRYAVELLQAAERLEAAGDELNG